MQTDMAVSQESVMFHLINFESKKVQHSGIVELVLMLL